MRKAGLAGLLPLKLLATTVFLTLDFFAIGFLDALVVDEVFALADFSVVFLDAGFLDVDAFFLVAAFLATFLTGGLDFAGDLAFTGDLDFAGDLARTEAFFPAFADFDLPPEAERADLVAGVFFGLKASFPST